MAYASAHEAARQLALRRWGDTVVRQAVATVVERRDELGPDLIAELRQVTETEADGDA